jgi:hypothetical protein
MLPPSTPSAPRHPQGECVGRVPACQNDTFSVQTAGGLFHVRWDHDSRISANGGMVHFAQFLEAAKVFDDWAADCPLSYESNRAHDVRDILGTWLLSAVNGHWRYAHITALRGDSVNPQLLRMRRVASEDAVRRALRRMDPEAARFWAQRHLLKTMAPLMSLPWILDIDVTIKSLYGYQEGSLVGHNPHKPGRPSHALHTFLLAKARLVLEVSVHAGDEHTSASTRGDLFGWLEKIPRHLWPSMLRGDCAYGTEDMMAWPETNGLHYLFKQRMTAHTRALVHELDLGQGWSDVGQGWSGIESTLRLSTWTKTRRVIVLRRRTQQRYPRRKDVRGAKQQVLDTVLPLITDDAFEYQVLVTNRDDAIATIAQLYRDRADAENVFDELKNHWGWGGFTSRKLSACQLSARMTAQVYNWWSIFVRLASPEHHREAVTSRPLLLHSMVRETTSGGQRLLSIVCNHAKAGLVIRFFTNLAAYLRGFSANAEQWTATERWDALLRKVYASAFGIVVTPSG